MLARGFFDDDVLLAETDPSAYEAALLPEEEAQIAQAVEKRRREYAAARGLLRPLVARLGAASGPIVNDADRAPIWPEGLRGTISHTAGYCGVALARASAYAGLGLDVEQGEGLKPALLPAVLREEERAALAGRGDEEAARIAKLVFSAKEAAYKAQYALSRTYLGFSAMRVDVDLDAGRFEACFMQPAGDVFRVGDVLVGSFRFERGLVACGVAIRADAPYAARR